MAWTTPVDYSTGQVITAAIWNDLIGAGGNIDETAPAKVTTAGDLIYGTAANAITRLGVGSAAQLLKVNAGATAPEWGAVAATEISAGAWKVFYSNATTTVELPLGAANTVLTSSGTSGVPTFAAAAGGGGSVQMTSSGSITAGTLVANSAANTVKAVTDTRSPMAQNTNALYTQGFQGSSYSSMMRWNGDTTTPTVLASWTGSAALGSGNWYVQAGTYASDTMTWGTTVEINAGVTHWYGSNGCFYDSTNNGWWTWAGTTSPNYEPYVNFNTVSGTSVTAGTPVQCDTGYSAYYYIQGGLTYDSDNSRGIFVYAPSSSLYILPFAISGTTLTKGTQTSTATASWKNPWGFWNTTYERLVIFGCKNDYKEYMFLSSWDSGTSTYIPATLNGSTTPIDTGTIDVSNPLYNMGAQAFDMGNDQYVFVNMNTTYNLIATTFTLDTVDTATIGPTSIFDGTTAVSANGTGVGTQIQLGSYGPWTGSYDTTSESLIIMARDRDDGKTLRSYTLKYNSSTGLWAQAGATLETTGDGAGGVIGGVYNGGAHCQVIDSSGNERFIWAAGSSTDAAGALIPQYFVNTASSGTTDARDVIGVSQDTVGTGVAVNVSVVGGLNETVSGLTSGKDYYIQGDGTLGLTADSTNYGKIGRSLATNKLLITGTGDNTVSNS